MFTYFRDTTLDVDSDYFARAVQILCEVAFKLSQTILRAAAFPGGKEIADFSGNEDGVELLRKKRFEEALMVFEYATGLQKTWTSESDLIRRNMIINKAQALIGLGRKDEAMKAVDGLDWSACHPRFKMALYLLKDEYENAGQLMKVAEVNEESYRTWPIFEKFRETSVFRTNFGLLFGKDFQEIPEQAVAAAKQAIDTGDVSGVIQALQAQADSKEGSTPVSAAGDNQPGESAGQPDGEKAQGA